MADLDSELVQQFVAVSGADDATAIMYLEMSGNCLETAIQLYLGMNRSTEGPPVSQSTDWWSVVFEGDKIPECWAIQGLALDSFQAPPSSPSPSPSSSSPSSSSSSPSSSSSSSSIGIHTKSEWDVLSLKQHKNGPCGVLAAFHATLIAHFMEQKRLTPAIKPTEIDVYKAIAAILIRIALLSDEPIVRFCVWGENPQPSEFPTENNVKIISVDIKEEKERREREKEGEEREEERIGSGENGDVLFAAFSPFLAHFLKAGGAMLLVYSAVLTRGFEKVRSDIQASGGDPYLVLAPFYTCTSALVSLILIGKAEDNLSAYGLDGKKVDWGVKSKVGLISGMEKELKIRINDTFKFPTLPVYVVHGRDHFTLVFQPENSPEKGGHEFKEFSEDEFPLIHFNGLPPFGPHFSSLKVCAPSGSVTVAPAEASKGIGVEYKPVVGAIDSIIQACSKDKKDRPNQWRTWNYEIALVIDDPTNVSPEMPPEMERPKTFELSVFPSSCAFVESGGNYKWRCRECYETRYKTMCFGLNDAPPNSTPSENICQNCGKTQKEAGWTLWVTYDELEGWRGQADREYGPKISILLRTKWPACQVEFANPDDPPVV